MSARIGIVALLFVATALAAVPSQAQSYTCVCTASACGNGGVGGDQGQVQTGASQNRLREWYALDRAGHSTQTGWTCVIEGSYTCTCDGLCGNDAIGANDGKVVGPVSAEDAINLFGAWRTAGRRTGWNCELGAPPKTAPQPAPTLPPTPAPIPVSAPSPKPAPPAAAVDVSGTWYDLDGREIQISQSGTNVTATMISTDGRQHWTEGNGRLDGGRLFMNHVLGGRVVDSQSGTLTGSDRIDWSNGTSWSRNTVAALLTPHPDSSSSSTSQTWSTGPSPSDSNTTKIVCESRGNKLTRCAAPGPVVSASLSRQFSKSSCSRGTGWGWEGDSIWVDRGCRAEFLVRCAQPTTFLSEAEPAGDEDAAIVALLRELFGIRPSTTSSVAPRPDDFLAGEWEDTYFARISITQSGDALRAQMLSPTGRQSWTHAEGGINGNTVALAHLKDGHVTDRQTGRLVTGDRIDWNDGTTWTRRPRTDSRPTLLSGRWRNSYGQPIRVAQDGNRLRVTMLASSGRRWWTGAEGHVDGGRVSLELFRDGRRVTSLTGMRVGRDRIQWPDGTVWTRY